MKVLNCDGNFFVAKMVPYATTPGTYAVDLEASTVEVGDTFPLATVGGGVIVCAKRDAENLMYLHMTPAKARDLSDALLQAADAYEQKTNPKDQS